MFLTNGNERLFVGLGNQTLAFQKAGLLALLTLLAQWELILWLQRWLSGSDSKELKFTIYRN